MLLILLVYNYNTRCHLTIRDNIITNMSLYSSICSYVDWISLSMQFCFFLLILWVVVRYNQSYPTKQHSPFLTAGAALFLFLSTLTAIIHKETSVFVSLPFYLAQAGITLILIKNLRIALCSLRLKNKCLIFILKRQWVMAIIVAVEIGLQGFGEMGCWVREGIKIIIMIFTAAIVQKDKFKIKGTIVALFLVSCIYHIVQVWRIMTQIVGQGEKTMYYSLLLTNAMYLVVLVSHLDLVRPASYKERIPLDDYSAMIRYNYAFMYKYAQYLDRMNKTTNHTVNLQFYDKITSIAKNVALSLDNSQNQSKVEAYGQTRTKHKLQVKSMCKEQNSGSNALLGLLQDPRFRRSGLFNYQSIVGRAEERNVCENDITALREHLLMYCRKQIYEKWKDTVSYKEMEKQYYRIAEIEANFDRIQINCPFF